MKTKVTPNNLPFELRADPKMPVNFKKYKDYSNLYSVTELTHQAKINIQLQIEKKEAYSLMKNLKSET